MAVQVFDIEDALHVDWLANLRKIKAGEATYADLEGDTVAMEVPDLDEEGGDADG